MWPMPTSRITLCPVSAVGPNMHGQPPAITVSPCSRPYAAAGSETLPGAGAAVHPDPLRCRGPRTRGRCLGVLGAGADHDAVHTALDRPQVVVGGVALDRRRRSG